MPSPPAFGSSIGQSPARLMARRAVEGRGRHVDDFTLSRTVEVAYVRSPFAHADIGHINTTAASALSGVVAVVTGKAIAERMTPWIGVMENQPSLKSVPQYALAVDRATWQGEPVVAIVAETRSIAEDAADLVVVDWTEKQPVTDMLSALDPASPVLHLAITKCTSVT